MKKKKLNWFVETTGFLWITTWFLSIWIEEYRWKLFFTGLFCFCLAGSMLQGKKKKD